MVGRKNSLYQEDENKNVFLIKSRHHVSGFQGFHLDDGAARKLKYVSTANKGPRHQPGGHLEPACDGVERV